MYKLTIQAILLTGTAVKQQAADTSSYNVQELQEVQDCRYNPDQCIIHMCWHQHLMCSAAQLQPAKVA